MKGLMLLFLSFMVLNAHAQMRNYCLLHYGTETKRFSLKEKPKSPGVMIHEEKITSGYKLRIAMSKLSNNNGRILIFHNEHPLLDWSGGFNYAGTFELHVPAKTVLPESLHIICFR